MNALVAFLSLCCVRGNMGLPGLSKENIELAEEDSDASDVLAECGMDIT